MRRQTHELGNLAAAYWSVNEAVECEILIRTVFPGLRVSSSRRNDLFPMVNYVLLVCWAEVRGFTAR